MKTLTPTPFPLVERARSSGIIESGNAFIVAPTGTGKSTIGRAIIRRAAANREQGLHAYIVPYSASAEVVYRSFQLEMANENITSRLKLAAADSYDAIPLDGVDILICTYQQCASLLSNPDLSLGRVVFDEFHLLADTTFGPLLEELLVRIKLFKQPTSFCAISAMVPNAPSIAKWLGVPLLKGGRSDRSVRVEMFCEITEKIDQQLAGAVKSLLVGGEQAIIFCDSKATAQKVARNLSTLAGRFVTPKGRQALNQLSTAIIEDTEDAGELVSCLPSGVAAYHADLSPESRDALERAFRDRCVNVITSTPPMAGGITVPVDEVLLRDLFRTEFLRGLPRRVLLSTGEVLNLLGHAGRSEEAKDGVGRAFVQRNALGREERVALQKAIREARGIPVRSRVPDSFDALMRFLLAVIVDRGTATIDVLGEALKKSFWYHQHPGKISFERQFKSDIMEDIPSFAKVPSTMAVTGNWIVSDGVAGVVRHGSREFQFGLRVRGMECSCGAASQGAGEDVCRHLACAIHHLLFDLSVSDEARGRAVYAAADLFRNTLDLGTKIREAVGLLRMWRLVEFVPGGFKATPVGVVAAHSNLDVLLVRTVGDRIRDLSAAPAAMEVLESVVEDYFPGDDIKKMWLIATQQWIGGAELETIKLPVKLQGDFCQGLDQLSRISALGAEIASRIDRQQAVHIYRTISVCLRCGVGPELVRLATPTIPELGRSECRYLYFERQVHDLTELANADPTNLVGPQVTLQLARQWVENAGKLVAQRNLE